MGRVLAFLPPKVSLDTLETLVSLIPDTESTKIIGLAMIAIHRGGGFEVLITGEAKRKPHETRGLVASLDDQLGRLTGSK